MSESYVVKFMGERMGDAPTAEELAIEERNELECEFIDAGYRAMQDIQRENNIVYV